jgi:predicted short-subunit dehydrogenase-like oxidoreductase (DUF2520 family)
MSVPDGDIKVIFLGAGNVATRLSAAMRNAGFSIVQVFSRTEESACVLGEKLSCDFTAETEQIRPDADVYVFSIKDDALPDIIAKTPANGGLWIHTAGSVPADVFEGYAERYGVIYPLQTLSKNRETDFRRIPLFVEGSSGVCEKEILHIAERISGDVRPMDSGKRKYLHIAAVFACNFSNHMCHIATRILEEQGIDRHVLLPLINETANRLHAMHPAVAQTGPAIRYDLGVINRHLAMLEHDPAIRSLYGLISKNIKSSSY